MFKFNKNFSALFICLALPFFMSGCMFFRLESNLKEIKGLAHLSGRVESTTVLKGALIVVLVKKGSYLEVINYKVQEKPNDFTFFVTPGTYRLVAYEDENNDRKYQATERVVKSPFYTVKKEEKVPDITLTIPTKVNVKLASRIEEMKKGLKINLVYSKKNIVSFTSSYS